jgi:hypothetical protein
MHSQGQGKGQAKKSTHKVTKSQLTIHLYNIFPKPSLAMYYISLQVHKSVLILSLLYYYCTALSAVGERYVLW